MYMNCSLKVKGLHNEKILNKIISKILCGLQCAIFRTEYFGNPKITPKCSFFTKYYTQRKCFKNIKY